jgi:hypothetical protein
MGLRTELERLQPREMIEALSIRIYEPPLSSARNRLRNLSEPLRVVILILDFDTEVTMNGMLGFLENSTGLFFAETIDDFKKIGSLETAEVLRCITGTLHKHGVTPSTLRSDFVGTELYQITNFRELHGDLGSLPDEIERDAQRLYLYGKPDSSELVWSLLEKFVEQNREAILAEIGQIASD